LDNRTSGKKKLFYDPALLNVRMAKTRKLFDNRGFVKNRDGWILQKDSDEIERDLYVSG
jgi:hypothetical protein